MFLAAARVLADQVVEADLALGRVYPALSQIREVSAMIAAEVAAIAYAQGLATEKTPADATAAALLPMIRKKMFSPLYPHYV
jgi:malate dehydrogenase (oxaloacetate-decarboxylating)(NADP+)